VLALAQAHTVADALKRCAIEPDVVVIRTAGDRGERSDKSRFVREIEQALLEGDVDIAVHSAKDVPTELPDGLALVGAPAAEDARDALVGASSLEQLPSAARVGTASLRRRSQLLAARPDLRLEELRGNVDTRLEKLARGEHDAIVLALAGLRRLGRAGEAGCALDEARFVPAPGQGVLALEVRAGDHARELVRALDDPASRARLEAERAVVAWLGATCHTPVGAHARVSGAALVIHAYVGLADGSDWVTDRIEGDAADAPALGAELGARMLAAGAGELLGGARVA
jgi:hydroxymethylbilane synthase